MDSYISRRRAEEVSDQTIAKELVTLRAGLKLANRAGLWLGAVDAFLPAGFAPDYNPRTRALSSEELRQLLAMLPRHAPRRWRSSWRRLPAGVKRCEPGEATYSSSRDGFTSAGRSALPVTGALLSAIQRSRAFSTTRSHTLPDRSSSSRDGVTCVGTFTSPAPRLASNLVPRTTYDALTRIGCGWPGCPPRL